MKRLLLLVIGVSLIVPATALAQQSDEDFLQMVVDFGRQTDDETLNMLVIHMNDVTTDTLFAAPAKYSLRAQARGATMFYIQGTVKENYELDMVWEIRWDNETRTAPLQTVNISNFEEGVTLSSGDQFTGILAFDTTLNLSRTVTLMNGPYRFDFLFPANVRSRIRVQ